MKSKLVLLFMLLLLVSCQPYYVAIVAPVTINGGFEEGWHQGTTYWTPSEGPLHTEFVEINTPDNWTTWWMEGFLCSGIPDWRTGRPEVRVISILLDTKRIHSGGQALKFFTFWRCHRGGLYQQVVVEPGQLYTAQAFGHAWFSRCSYRPHSTPYDSDCVTPINWAHDWLSVGLDPLGGADPTAPSVVWDVPREVYGKYGEPLSVERIEAISSTMTVFLQSDASHPLKHNDVYWDDVTLSKVHSHQVFLPLAFK